MGANKFFKVFSAAALVLSGHIVVAQEPEQDSAYQWGRWAVLSPAAGGQPFIAPDDPGAQFNARPGEASEFQPKVQTAGGSIGIVDINPNVPVVTAPPTVAPPPPPPPVPPLGLN